MRPKLIIATGRPAAGKSTLANRLAEELKIPIISKDGIREVLLNRLGIQDRAWAQTLGNAGIDLMFYFARAELGAGRSIILDNAFNPTISAPLFRELIAAYNADCLQIVCDAESEILFQRFKSRVESGSRHPGHREEMAYDQLRESLSREESYTLDVDGEIIEVDTTDFEKIDFDGILDRTRKFLEK